MPASCGSADSRKPSPSEAKENLMHAISYWWPHMDHAGKSEVTAFFFKQKRATRAGVWPRRPCRRVRGDSQRARGRSHCNAEADVIWRIASLAANGRLPAMGAAREFVDVGGLMSYGANLRDL